MKMAPTSVIYCIHISTIYYYHQFIIIIIIIFIRIVIIALEVFLNDVRYINQLFTYLLTYLLTYSLYRYHQLYQEIL